MKQSVILLVIASLFCFTMCKSKEKHTKSTSTNDAKKTIVVSFISKGSGIDHQARIELDSLIASKAEIDCDFESSILKKGREGERKYCLVFTDNRCYNRAYGTLAAKFDNKELVKVDPKGVCKK